MTGILTFIFTAFALLPLRVLYWFADLAYLVLYHIVRYRRTTVRDNLCQCFPEKTPEELRRIEKQFYRNFADYVVETVKLLHISDSEMKRRMEFRNIGLMDSLMAEGKSIAIYFGHIGNWEWAPSVTLHTKVPPSAAAVYAQVYRPLRNRTFDALMLKIRSRFGSVSIPKAVVLRTLLKWRKDGAVSATGFMSDQKPSHGDPTVPLRFLGRPTAFISGTENLARRLGMAAIYWDTEKIARGHYIITCRLLAENAADTEPGHITAAYARMLEKSIIRNPAIWLWTHKRWKYPVDPSSLLY